MKEKCDLRKMLEESKEDGRVFGVQPDYWATQKDIDPFPQMGPRFYKRSLHPGIFHQPPI